MIDEPNCPACGAVWKADRARPEVCHWCGWNFEGRATVAVSIDGGFIFRPGVAHDPESDRAPAICTVDVGAGGAANKIVASCAICTALPIVIVGGEFSRIPPAIRIICGRGIHPAYAAFGQSDPVARTDDPRADIERMPE